MQSFDLLPSHEGRPPSPATPLPGSYFNPLPSHEGRPQKPPTFNLSISNPLCNLHNHILYWSEIILTFFGFCKLHPSFPVRIHRYFYVRLGFALPSISITNCFLSSYRSAFRLASQSFKKESHTGPIAKALPSFWSFLSLYNLCNWNTRQFY